MAEITLKGNSIHTVGSLPALGTTPPNFSLTTTEMKDVSLADYSGKKIILNIFPSIDTPVCANSVRKFNVDAAKLSNTVVLCVSADLPFAHKRFCGAEGIANVVSVSEFKQHKFGEDYGLRITDGPLAGLLSRAVIVIDEKNKVVYTEQVPEIAQEPNYEKALASLN